MSVTKQNILPSGWDRTTLGEVLSILRGVSYTKDVASSSPSEGLVPILRATNISEKLTFGDFVYVPEKYVSAEQFLRPGDIVVAASSGSRKLVGKAVQLTSEWRGSFGAFCYALRPADKVCSKLLAYYLQTSDYRNKISDLSAGVNINNLKREHIAGIDFPFPPHAEQSRIVEEIEKHFTRLDAAVAGLKRVRANLKRYRASVLKAACEGRLVPTEAELAKAEGRDYEPADRLLSRILKERREKWEADQLAKMRAQGKSPKDEKWKVKYIEPSAPQPDNLPAIPAGWAWVKADQVCTQITDGEHIQPRYQPQGLPMLTAKHVRGGYVDFTDAGLIAEHDFQNCLKRCAPQEEDVLVVSVGATTGRAAIVGNVRPFAIVRSVLMLRPIITPRFLLRWIQSPWCQTWISRASGSSAQAHLYISDTKNIPVPLPPLAEQHRIVAEVERRLSVVEELEATVEANLKRAERLRQSILKRAFEGRLVPQDPADEPAGALLERIRSERLPGRKGRKKTDAAPPPSRPEDVPLLKQTDAG